MASLTDRMLRNLLVGYGYRSQHLPTSVGRVHLFDRGGTGSLPPLLFLHGFGASALNFAPLLLALHDEVEHIWLPDLPCHGLSDTPEGGLSGDTLLTGVVEGLHGAHDRPAVLVGTSLGGAVAVRYALRNRERVRGLVLVSPGGTPLSEEELETVRRHFQVPRHLDGVELVDRLRGHSSWTSHLFAPGLRARLSDPLLHDWLSAVTPEEFLSAEELGALDVPVLLLWGTEERLLPPSVLDFYVKALPQVTLETPEGWGHSPMLTDPTGVRRRILDFARGLPA